MEDTSDVVEGREQCPKCAELGNDNSGDNLARYTDGHAHCYSCGHHEAGSGEGSVATRDTSKPTDFVPLEHKSVALTSRRITARTCERFGYGVGTDLNGKTIHVCDVRGPQGNLLAQKVRGPNKSFWTNGKLDTKPLIGMHLWSGGKQLVITEGEIDMLSYAEVSNCKWPVVSLPNGAQNARKVINENLEYCSQFDSVILMFDMDDPGQQAAQEAAGILMSVTKVKLAKLPLKDASDCLQAGRGEDVMKAVWNASEYKPAGLVTLADIKDEVMKPVDWGLEWFLPTLNQLTYGRRKGEVYFFGAGTGVGKTDLFTQCIAHDVKTLGKKVFVAYLEMGKQELGKRLCGKFAHQQFHIPDAGWTMGQLERALSDPVINENVIIYDNFGTTDFDDLEVKMTYEANRGTELFFIDHLTALATGADKSEKEELEDITSRMAKMAKKLDIIIHVISHLTTPDKGPSHEEGGRVTIRQFKGSRAIGFWAHFMFGMERNQQADDPVKASTTTFRILKDRYTGRATGKKIYLGYDQDTGLLYETQEPSADSNPFEEERF